RGRLINDYKVGVEMGRIRVAYRESIPDGASSTFTASCQTSAPGRGASHATVTVRLSHNHAGGGNIIDVESLVAIQYGDGRATTTASATGGGGGGNLPTEWADAVREGVVDGLSRGPILSYPVTDVVATVTAVQLSGSGQGLLGEGGGGGGSA